MGPCAIEKTAQKTVIWTYNERSSLTCRHNITLYSLTYVKINKSVNQSVNEHYIIISNKIAY